MKTKRQLKILDAINERKHHFTEILEYLEWSKATISKYLSSLVDLNILEKKVTKEGRVGYFLTKDGEIYRRNIELFSEDFERLDKPQNKNILIEKVKSHIEKINELKRLGVYDEYVDLKELIPFLKRKDNWYKKESDKDYLRICDLNQLFVTFPPELSKERIDGEIKIKLEKSPDKIIKELKEAIERIKKEGMK